MNLLDIKDKLKNKTIFLLPYCHADHAWCHSRKWHQDRYSFIYQKTLELFKRYPEFCFFMDSWSEFMQHCLQVNPTTVKNLKKLINQERFALVGGQWSNLRFQQVGNETSIRNIIYGKKAVRKYFPDARLDAYANLDISIGHSQVPQILALGGYKYYFAWRPQKGLDEQGMPRSFRWSGLSGDEVLTTRHSYQGWFHTIEFNQQDGEPDFSSQKIDFEHTVRYAWDKFLKVPCSQKGLQTLSFCQGGDDCIPLVDAFYGFERDLPSLIERWNKEGFGKLSFGTPYSVFDALEKQRDDLPVWNELPDPTSVYYNIARNGKNGAWWVRELSGRELLLAEQLATLSSICNSPYPFKDLQKYWHMHLTFCTHAIELLFAEDFDKAQHVLNTVIHESTEIQNKTLGYFIDSKIQDRITIFNPLPERREKEIISLPIINIDNSRRKPILKDDKGEILPSQITYKECLAHEFDVLVETDLPPANMKEITVDWSDKDIEISPPVLNNKMNIQVNSGPLRLKFIKGRLKKIEGRHARHISGSRGEGLLEPMSLPQDVDYWMAKSFSENPLPFVPESLSLIESGPLRYKIMRTGTSGKHHFTQYFDLYRGREAIDITTIADISRDSTSVVLGMPLEHDGKISVDVPFGVEKRDLSKIVYGHMGEGHFENIERRVPGIFWGKSWVFVESGKKSFGLISVDGPRHYRRYGKPLKLLHFLISVKPDRYQRWLPKTHMGKVLGRHVFHHQLVLSGSNWKKASMPKRAHQARTKTPIYHGGISQPMNNFEINPEQVRLSALYCEDKHIILRIVNIDDKPNTAEILFPQHLKSVSPCDFLGNSLKIKIKHQKNKITTNLSPWQILTLKLTCC